MAVSGLAESFLLVFIVDISVLHSHSGKILRTRPGGILEGLADQRRQKSVPRKPSTLLDLVRQPFMPAQLKRSHTSTEGAMRDLKL